MNNWYTSFEAPLASAFLDTRCPFTFLDPKTHGPDPEVMHALDQPWSFDDFKKGWDFPDSSQFDEWCKAHTLPDKGQDPRRYDGQAACKPQEVPIPLVRACPSSDRKRESLQELRDQRTNVIADVVSVKSSPKVACDWKQFTSENRPPQRALALA